MPCLTWPRVYPGLRQAGAATSFTLTKSQSLALLASYSTGMPNPGNTLGDDNRLASKFCQLNTQFQPQLTY